MSKKTTQLKHLPPEVMYIIAGNLSTRELTSLGKTSRKIKQSTSAARFDRQARENKYNVNPRLIKRIAKLWRTLFLSDPFVEKHPTIFHEYFQQNVVTEGDLKHAIHKDGKERYIVIGNKQYRISESAIRAELRKYNTGDKYEAAYQYEMLIALKMF